MERLVFLMIVSKKSMKISESTNLQPRSTKMKTLNYFYRHEFIVSLRNESIIYYIYYIYKVYKVYKVYKNIKYKIVK